MPRAVQQARGSSLIATVLTVTPAPGIVIDRIAYPAAVRLPQADRVEPLSVFGPELVIDVHLSAAPGAPRRADHAAGATALPGVRRASLLRAVSRAGGVGHRRGTQVVRFPERPTFTAPHTGGCASVIARADRAEAVPSHVQALGSGHPRRSAQFPRLDARRRIRRGML